MSDIAIAGRCSVFGGPDDDGVAPDEGLALFEPSAIPAEDPTLGGLFLPEPPAGTTGLARRLNPAAHYIACRWDYEQTPKDWLVRQTVIVRAPKTGITAGAQPADWGPDPATGRAADLSPGLANTLGIGTGDEVEVTVPIPPKAAVMSAIPDAIREAQSAYKPRLSTLLNRLEATRRAGARVFTIDDEELAGVLEEIDKRLEGIAFYLATKQRAEDAKAGDGRTQSMDKPTDST